MQLVYEATLETIELLRYEYAYSNIVCHQLLKLFLQLEVYDAFIRLN